MTIHDPIRAARHTMARAVEPPRATVDPMALASSLPTSCPPRGLSREQAAEYVGVGATKFDEMVKDGRMPRPLRIDSRTVWDRVAIDAAFTALGEPTGDGRGGWDRAL